MKDLILQIIRRFRILLSLFVQVRLGNTDGEDNEVLGSGKPDDSDSGDSGKDGGQYNDSNPK